MTADNYKVGNELIKNFLSVAGSVDISGATILRSTLGVTSNTNITGTLDVSGATTLRDNIIGLGSLTVSGPSMLQGSIIVNTTIYASGNITSAGSIIGAVKDFMIDHPLDPEHKSLIHSSLEGIEHGVYYRGESQIKKGNVIIQLPNYFDTLTSYEDRSVQLTCKNGYSNLFVSGEISGNSFMVCGIQGQEFYWQVNARRNKDPFIDEIYK